MLRERGDEVLALVRDPARPKTLVEIGTDLVASDLSSVDALTDQLQGADAVIHAAGSYRVGIPKSERGAMWDANVGTTTRVLDAAEAAATRRVVYVSTMNVFGNTRGRVVDESYRRDLSEGFLSWYDETKYGAHEVVEQRIAGGAPVVIVLPSQVYGPGDRSTVGDQIRRAYEGRLSYRALDRFGIGMVHADDLAAGIVAALERGESGRSYILSGPRTLFGEAIAIAARIGGHEPPRLRLPDGFVRAMSPLGRLIGQANLAEIVSSAAGVTYLGSSSRAEAELGFKTRDIETGLRDVYGATASSPRAE